MFYIINDEFRRAKFFCYGFHTLEELEQWVSDFDARTDESHHLYVRDSDRNYRVIKNYYIQGSKNLLRRSARLAVLPKVNYRY